MGCCLSTKNTQPQSSKPNSTQPPLPPPNRPLDEEETVVKEVLSETPSLPKQPISILSQNEPTKEPLNHFTPTTNVDVTKPDNPCYSPNAKVGVIRPDNPVPARYSPNAKVGVSRSDNSVPARCSPNAKLGNRRLDNSTPASYLMEKNRLDYAQTQHTRKPETKKSEKVVSNKKQPLPEELSEEVLSEICSALSESCISTTTAATNETNNFADDDNDVTQVVRRTMSPARHRNRQVTGDQLVGRPQRRRSEASTGRVRSSPVRDGRGQNNNGMRRGPVMGPDRRSRSPVARVEGSGSRAGLSRCPSGRRTGKSPARFGPPELVDKNSKLEQAEPKVETGNCAGDGEATLDPTNDESLENPHVSMECFIFL